MKAVCRVPWQGRNSAVTVASWIMFDILQIASSGTVSFSSSSLVELGCKGVDAGIKYTQSRFHIFCREFFVVSHINCLTLPHLGKKSYKPLKTGGSFTENVKNVSFIWRRNLVVSAVPSRNHPFHPKRIVYQAKPYIWLKSS